MKTNSITPSTIKTTVKATANTTKSVSIKDAAREFTTLSRSGTMNRNLFIANAFAFLLGSRLVTSRDKDEIRETLIRDVPTIIIAVMGVPVASKLIAGKFQKSSGFALLHETEKSDTHKWFDKLLGKKGETTTTEASYDKLSSWYQYKDKSTTKFDATKFEGFTDRLAGLNGNLKKICSSLSSEFKTRLEALPQDNEGFKKALFRDEKLVQDVAKEFASDKNGALKIALFKKTITKMSGYAAILAIVGLAVPKGNILLTNILHRGDKIENKPDKKTSA